MKKNLLSILGIAASFGAFAQLPVSTSPENKNVILEEFTGIYCGFCPAGHVIANTLTANNPEGDVVVINVHAGGFAAPNGADPDFRTPFGQALDNQSNVAGYPAGTVNRHLFPGLEQSTTNPGTAMGRGNWTQAANEILTELSYANVALEGTVDFDTRLLTVDVEAHFTGTPPATMNLNVALMQNNIEGPQSGMAANPSAVINGRYNHQHMLRHFLTGQWGEVITTGGQGATYTGQFTYTLPADINGIPVEIGNLEIAAYLAEGQQEIITGAKGPLTFTNGPINNVALDQIISSDACADNQVPQLVVKNIGTNEITSLQIRSHLGGQNVTFTNWTGSIAAFATETITLDPIAVPTDIGTSLTSRITLVNGVQDTEVSDNEKNVPLNIISGSDFTFEFNQDRYGAESTWSIYEDGMNGSPILTGGPYTDLTSNTTVLHTYPLTISEAGCYVIQVDDGFGDGINGGYGAGGYDLVNSDGVSSLNFDGIFTDQNINKFRVLSLTPLAINSAEAVDQLSVFPNPVTNIANIEFFLTDAEGANLTIFDISGKVVYNTTNLDQGQNIINFDVTALGSGMYFTTIQTENGSTSAKFTVAK